MGNEENQHEHRKSILKATTLLGGSSFITIIINMVRVKVVALILGPSGVGFIGILTGLKDVVLAVCGLGVTASGIREIAHLNGQDQEEKVKQIVKTLMITVIVLGSLGLIFFIIFRVLLSELSFGNIDFVFPVTLMGFAVLISLVSNAQTAILQGFRRINDVAKVNILGAFLGALIVIPLFYFWGIDGVAPSIVLSAVGALAVSWFFTRNIRWLKVPLNKDEFLKINKKLVTLGFPLMLSGFVALGSNYAIKVFLTKVSGLDGVGLYQAAFGLAGVLVNFVIGAMGTDYYPRITAVADDNSKVNSLVNLQTEISLLLAIPALAATIVFMPFVMNVFYSNKFLGANLILKWAIFGTLGRVLSWPLGFVLLAKARGGIFFVTEMIVGIIHIVFVVVLYYVFGMQGSGMAYGLLYLVYTCMMVLVNRKIAGIVWSRFNKILISISILVVSGLTVIQSLPLNFYFGLIVQSMLLFLVTFFYLKKLFDITGMSIKDLVRKFRK